MSIMDLTKIVEKMIATTDLEEFLELQIEFDKKLNDMKHWRDFEEQKAEEEKDREKEL